MYTDYPICYRLLHLSSQDFSDANALSTNKGILYCKPHNGRQGSTEILQLFVQERVRFLTQLLQGIFL